LQPQKRTQPKQALENTPSVLMVAADADLKLLLRFTGYFPIGSVALWLLLEVVPRLNSRAMPEARLGKKAGDDDARTERCN
jgi:hypothetical protein